MMQDNKYLKSLEGIHLHIKSIGYNAGTSGRGTINFIRCPIESHVLGLLLIENLKYVTLDNQKVKTIINKYLDGSRDVFECQQELMDAGLDEYAQL
jgi:hypothetical protein